MTLQPLLKRPQIQNWKIVLSIFINWLVLINWYWLILIDWYQSITSLQPQQSYWHQLTPATSLQNLWALRPAEVPKAESWENPKGNYHWNCMAVPKFRAPSSWNGMAESQRQLPAEWHGRPKSSHAFSESPSSVGYLPQAAWNARKFYCIECVCILNLYMYNMRNRAGWETNLCLTDLCRCLYWAWPRTHIYIWKRIYIYIYIYIYIDSHMAPYGACEVAQSTARSKAQLEA